jgi:hypothetical protein
MNTIPDFRIDTINKTLDNLLINNCIEPLVLDSFLIEALLLRFKIPPVYLDRDNNLLLEHRIISNFYLFKQGKAKLTNLKYFKDLEELTYNQIPRNYQRRLEELEVMVVRLEWAEETMLEQFKEFWSN